MMVYPLNLEYMNKSISIIWTNSIPLRNVIIVHNQTPKIL